jgi:enamine deaminase RidA (YjgF/YER057c/UK114 family)
MQASIVDPDLARIVGGFPGARYYHPEPPLDANDTLPGEFNAQFEASLSRLKVRLSGDGLDLDHVLRAEIHVTRDGPDAYAALQDAFLLGFSTLPRPARCVSASPGLAHGGMVEIGGGRG